MELNDGSTTSCATRKTQLNLTWIQINEMVENIVAKMRRHNYFPLTIMGIARGGLLPAAALAYRFSITSSTHPSVETIYAWSYIQDKQIRRPIEVEWPQKEHLERLNHESTLIVDDITDSGNTMQAFKDVLPKAKTATLIHKRLSEFTPDFVGIVDHCHENWWYNFPWEDPAT